MSNSNETTRAILRWTHLLVGFPIGVFVYTPAHGGGTFVPPMCRPSSPPSLP